ncbi:MAG: hypothetical protein H6822_19880 [Planctomycetaceae bacterium]|nr:hypothetical protein [Planctomycetaceae bacterium]
MGDDFRIEVVGSIGVGPKVTGVDEVVLQTGYRPSLDNLDFEQGLDSRSFPKLWGGGGKGYSFSIDLGKSHQGSGSGKIEKTGQGDHFGSLTRSISANDYRGKRIMYSGFIAAEKATLAKLWMRIDAVEDGQTTPIDFADTAKYGTSDTSDWIKHFVVLDVPEDANNMTFGFLLEGDGAVWGDDLKIEVVGNLSEGPETTGVGREKMRSINAANRVRRSNN